jgi:hypothetical protein
MIIYMQAHNEYVRYFDQIIDRLATRDPGSSYMYIGRPDWVNSYKAEIWAESATFTPEQRKTARRLTAELERDTEIALQRYEQVVVASARMMENIVEHFGNDPNARRKAATLLRFTSLSELRVLARYLKPKPENSVVQTGSPVQVRKAA